MTAFSDPQSRSYARTTGLFYLTIAIAGGFSIAYVPSVLQVPGDPAATFANLTERRGLFHLGIGGDVVMMLAEIMATAMLFFMFRTVNPTLSLAAALARFAMVAVMAAMLFFHAGAMAIVDGTALTAFAAAERRDIAELLWVMHDSGVWIWQVFFTMHLWLLGVLVLRSGVYPTVLGAGLIVGGAGYILDSAYAFMFPDAAWLAALRVGLLTIVTLSEVGFALWLIFVGPRGGARPATAAGTL